MSNKNYSGRDNPVLQTILGFQKKGWGLYQFERNAHGVRDVFEIVRRGRAKSSLDLGINYGVLPLIKDDKNPRKVINAIKNAYRPPRYIELSQRELCIYQQEKVLPFGAPIHPVKSIVFDGSLTLIVDKRLYGEGENPNPKIEKPEFKIEYNFIEEKLEYCISEYKDLDEVLFKELENIPKNKIC